MTDSIVSSILDLLKREARLFIGVEDEVEDLKRTLEFIGAVLADAERKKFRSENSSLKVWLDSLKEASLDMEDALTAWVVEAALIEDARVFNFTPCIGVELDDLLWKLVRGFTSCFSFSRLVRRCSVAHSIKEINKRLDKIAKGRDRYKLEEGEINKHSTLRETSSFVRELDVLGRDEDKKIILNHFGVGLKSGDVDDDSVVEEDGPIKVISLVGMGGLGKTTIAQLVYNDQALREHFDGAVIWVCVSDIFDEIKVVKAIVERLDKFNGSATQGREETNTWQANLERLFDAVRKKKFFLVLDDVWGDKKKKWEELLLCFRKSAAKGSSILVTTRKIEVATMMGCSESQIIPLRKLGDEVCWSIIKQIALKGRASNEMLEKVGRGIAVKCKGLPLAANAVGGLLEGKGSISEWKTVLDSEIWSIESMPEDVFTPLMLSYHDLPPAVRRCFLFCVIYPKDHDIEVNALINHWMSHDYLGFDDDVDWELEGRKCFNILANRSFFQDFERMNDRDNLKTTVGTEILCCKMHDLVHDFAKYMVGGEFVTEILRPRSSIMLEKCRHLTMLIKESSSFPRSISGAKTLRSLRIHFSSWRKDEPVVEGLPNLLKQSKMLRLLELQHPPLKHLDQALKGARILIHLKELKLCSSMEQLPEAFSNLQNLTILDLIYCASLTELPSWVGKLKKLRVLDTRYCLGLGSYLKEIAQLTCLEYLHGAHVRIDHNDDQEFSIADLENLRRLRSLSLRKVTGEEVNVDELNKAQLSDLRRLLVSHKASTSVVLKAFLETLKLNLPSTTIDYYPDF